MLAGVGLKASRSQRKSCKGFTYGCIQLSRTTEGPSRTAEGDGVLPLGSPRSYGAWYRVYVTPLDPEAVARDWQHRLHGSAMWSILSTWLLRSMAPFSRKTPFGACGCRAPCQVRGDGPTTLSVAVGAHLSAVARPVDRIGVLKTAKRQCAGQGKVGHRRPGPRVAGRQRFARQQPSAR